MQQTFKNKITSGKLISTKGAEKLGEEDVKGYVIYQAASLQKNVFTFVGTAVFFFSIFKFHQAEFT